MNPIPMVLKITILLVLPPHMQETVEHVAHECRITVEEAAFRIFKHDWRDELVVSSVEMVPEDSPLRKLVEKHEDDRSIAE